jgi:hypothetical protein
MTKWQQTNDSFGACASRLIEHQQDAHATEGIDRRRSAIGSQSTTSNLASSRRKQRLIFCVSTNSIVNLADDGRKLRLFLRNFHRHRRNQFRLFLKKKKIKKIKMK